MLSVELVDIASTSLTEVIWHSGAGDVIGTVTGYNVDRRQASFTPNDAEWGLQRWVDWSALDIILPDMAGIIRGRTGNRCEISPNCRFNFDLILTMDTGEGTAQAFRCNFHGESMTEQAVSYTRVTWAHCILISPRTGWRKVSTGLTGRDVANLRDLYNRTGAGTEGKKFKVVPEFE